MGSRAAGKAEIEDLAERIKILRERVEDDLEPALPAAHAALRTCAGHLGWAEKVLRGYLERNPM